MKYNRKLTVAVAAFVVLTFSAFTAIAQKNTSLSDAEVASVAVVANQVDIGYAEIAKKKTTNAEVIKFAQTMIDDHTAVIEKAAALAKKLNVTPKENEVSKKLLADAKKTKDILQARQGHAFDKAYVDNEVAYHKAVIATVENLLIPETDNQELKELLQSVVPALKAHLGHAEMLQKNLK